MNLIFENESGRLLLSGKGGGRWHIISASGLDLPTHAEQTAVYSYEDGQELLSSTAQKRIITIKGDLQMKGDDLYELSNAMRLLSHGGSLKLTNGARTRAIDFRCKTFEPQRRTGDTRQFVIQLVCDNPYFRDGSEKTDRVIRQTKLLHGTFCFNPELMLSSAVSSAAVVNSGYVKSEPVFYITNLGASMAEDGAISLTNHTTGQTVCVNYPLSAGETMVVSIPDRSVTGKNGSSLISRISDGTHLSDFYLAEGTNEITASGCEKMQVLCKHYNRYAEAVF